jgi:hypothetical protein
MTIWQPPKFSRTGTAVFYVYGLKGIIIIASGSAIFGGFGEIHVFVVPT